MVLNAKHRTRLMPQALDRAVVQVLVCDLDVGRKRLRIDGEAVILRRDFDLSGRQLLDRMICPAMTELELERSAAHRQTEYLMTQTDAERGHVRVDQRPGVVDRVGQDCWIARTIAQEDAVQLGRA